MKNIKELLKEEIPDIRLINRKINKIVKHSKHKKKFYQLMVKVWSEDEDSRRVLAFVNIMKGLSCKPESINMCIKLMFFAFVRNCKFVVGSNVCQINFMRESLLEVLSKNLDESYLHCFVFLRQLAITLRKAYTSHLKDDLQSVRNWQFIYSLYLWSDFIARNSQQHELIKSLIHPLVQIIVGTIRLNSGERWIPLRFHCISMLHSICGVPILKGNSDNSGETKLDDDQGDLPLSGRSLQPLNRILLPSLPLLMDVFQLVNFNRRSASASKAPFDLRLFLHFSPSHIRESASLDSIVNWLFDLLLESVAIHANSVCFPELVFPLLTELKTFTKLSRVAAFNKQMKSLYTKIKEHSDWITKCRRHVQSLNNEELLLSIESTCTMFSTQNSNTLLPFWEFYIQHKKIRRVELNRLTENNKKEPIYTESSKDRKGNVSSKRDDDEDDDDESDQDSDGSFDYDDGVTVTHVSKSSANKSKSGDSKNVVDDDDQDDDDFDLQAALNEQEDNEPTYIEDQVMDFELDDNETSARKRNKPAKKNVKVDNKKKKLNVKSPKTRIENKTKKIKTKKF